MPGTGCERTGDAEPPLDPAAGNARLRRGDGRRPRCRRRLRLPAVLRRARRDDQRRPRIPGQRRRRSGQGGRLRPAGGPGEPRRPRRELRRGARLRRRGRRLLGGGGGSGPAGAGRVAAGSARADLSRSRSPFRPRGRVAAAGGPACRQGAAAGGRRRHLDRGAGRVADGPAAAPAPRRPGRAAAGLACRLWSGGRCPEAGRGDALAGGRDLRRGARQATLGAAEPRRDRPPWHHAQRDARAAGGGARARAGVRRRCQSRAANAAGDPAHRAGAGPGRRPLGAGAAQRDRLGGGGDRPLDPALRGPSRPSRRRSAASCR